METDALRQVWEDLDDDDECMCYSPPLVTVFYDATTPTSLVFIDGTSSSTLIFTP